MTIDNPKNDTTFPILSSLKRLFLFSLFSLIILPLIPILLSTWYLYRYEVDRVENHLQETNHQVALLAHQSFNALIQQIAFVLSQEEIDNAKLRENAIVYWIDVAEEGSVIASNNRSWGSSNPLKVEPEWKNFGELPNLPLDVSDIVDLDFLSSPTFLIRTPGKNGYRIAVVDYLHFQQWFTASLDTLFHRHVYVVDSKGQPLFYSDMKLINQVEAFKSNPPVAFFLNGNSGPIRYISTISQNERIAFVLPITEVGWGLVVSADIGNRIFALRARLFWIIVAFVASGLLALVIFININRKVMAPLASITQQLHRQDSEEHKRVSLPKRYGNVEELKLLVNEFNQYANAIMKAKHDGIQAEKMATMGELTTGLAHELGTPLNVIRGNAQYLSRKLTADQNNKELISKIIFQTDRISDLLRRLLDVARIDGANSGPISIATVVNRALDTIKEIYPKTTLHTKFDSGVPPIHGFARRLEHAFLNIFDNACQAMDGSGDLWVSIKSVKKADVEFIQVSIEDSGAGISSEDLPNIFHPFFSTKGSGKGTGLGLALVDRVIKEHDGQIKVNSITGQGTLFTISFPFKAVQEGE